MSSNKENNLVSVVDQIGYHHILTVDGFSFCLLCKHLIFRACTSKGYTIICNHLVGKKHKENLKILFKVCVPDQSCESLDRKFLDIVENSVFDVSWEVGNESSYVCKQGKNLVCLICEKTISTIHNSFQKIQPSLACHLESELHKNSIRDIVCWIYHPFDDINYIVFHKHTVYCSLCQKYLLCTQETMLEVSANHIQSDSTRLRMQQRVHETSIDDLCHLFESLAIKNDDDCNSNETRQITDVPPIIENLTSKQTLNICDLTQTRFQECSVSSIVEHKLNVVGANNYSVVGQSETELVLKKLLEELSVIKLNKYYIKVKHNRFFCSICQVFLDFDKCGIDLKYHCFTLDHNSLLAKNAYDFMEMLKTERNLAVEDKPSEKFDIVISQISHDKKFRPHLKYIGTSGEDFICYLCFTLIPFSTCGKYVETHFFDPCHLTNSFKVNYDSASSEQQKSQMTSDIKKEILETLKHNTTSRYTNKVLTYNTYMTNFMRSSPKEISVAERRRIKVLNKLSDEIFELKLNDQFITLKVGRIYCEVCHMFIASRFLKHSLSEHCISKTHNQILMKNAVDYVADLGKNCLLLRSGQALQMLQSLLSEMIDSYSENLINSNLMFITVKSARDNPSCSWLFCLLCQANTIAFSKEGIETHLTSNFHKKKLFELNCSTVSNTACEELLGSATTWLNLSSKVDDVENQSDPTGSDTSVISEVAKECNLNTRGQGDQIKDRLTVCLKCGELVEMYGSDAELSIRIHLNQHVSFFSLDDDLDEKNQENTVYTCLDCCNPIIITNDNLKLSLSRHFEDFHPNSLHVSKSNCTEIQSQPEKLAVYHNLTARDGNVFFSVLCDCHLSSIDMLNGSCYCSLCEVCFPFSENINETMKHICLHSNDDHHQNKMKLFLNKEEPSVLTRSNNIPKTKPCSTVKKVLCVNVTKEEVKQIFQVLPKKNKAVKVNLDYLKVNETYFYCCLCEVTMLYTGDGSHLVAHCLSVDHNQLLSKIASEYMKSIDVEPLADSSTKSLEKYKVALAKVAECFPFNKISSHLKFVSMKNNNFYCNACKKKVQFSPDGLKVQGHFESVRHREMTYNISFGTFYADVQVEQEKVILIPGKNISEAEKTATKESTTATPCEGTSDKPLPDESDLKNLFGDGFKFLDFRAEELLKDSISYLENRGKITYCRLCKCELHFWKKSPPSILSGLVTHCGGKKHAKSLYRSRMTYPHLSKQRNTQVAEVSEEESTRLKLLGESNKQKPFNRKNNSINHKTASLSHETNSEAVTTKEETPDNISLEIEHLAHQDQQSDSILKTVEKDGLYNFYCRVCNIELPGGREKNRTLKNLALHCGGKLHKKKLNLSGKIINSKGGKQHESTSLKLLGESNKQKSFNIKKNNNTINHKTASLSHETNSEAVTTKEETPDNISLEIEHLAHQDQQSDTILKPIEKDGLYNFYCRVCNIELPGGREKNRTLTNLALHCGGKLHKMKLNLSDKIINSKVHQKSENIINPTSSSQNETFSSQINGFYLVNKVFEYLPEELKSHNEFIHLEGYTFYCDLCKKLLMSSTSLFSDCRMIQQHLTQPCHDSIYRELLLGKKTEVNSEQINENNLEPCDPNSNAIEKFEEIDFVADRLKSLIEQYKQYLEMNKTYTCKVCQVTIVGFEEEDGDAFKHLSEHFNGEPHNSKLILYGLITENSEVTKVLAFGDYEHFHCSVCNVMFTSSSDGKGFVNHFEGVFHKNHAKKANLSALSNQIN